MNQATADVWLRENSGDSAGNYAGPPSWAITGGHITSWRNVTESKQAPHPSCRPSFVTHLIIRAGVGAPAPNGAGVRSPLIIFLRLCQASPSIQRWIPTRLKMEDGQVINLADEGAGRSGWQSATTSLALLRVPSWRRRS